ncbi:MAG: hypothetical protein ACR2QV_13535 [Gammaproteobacteria bacterium]
MTTKKDDKQKTGSTAAGGVSLLNNAYKAGIGAARTMHQTAVDIPLTILEQMGLEKDKVAGLRAKSHELIEELYHAIDAVASKSGVVGGDKDSAPKASDGK